MFANRSFNPRSACPGTARRRLGPTGLSPSEQLDRADRGNRARRHGLLTCKEAYVNYRRAAYPDEFVPDPEFICGPFDHNVMLSNVLPPRFEDLMCTLCGESEELRAFPGTGDCTYVMCVPCNKPTKLPSGDITQPDPEVDRKRPFCIYEKPYRLFRTWRNRGSVEDSGTVNNTTTNNNGGSSGDDDDDDNSNNDHRDDSNAFFRPHRSLASSPSSAPSSSEHAASCAPAGKSSIAGSMTSPPATPAPLRAVSAASSSTATSPPDAAVARRAIAPLPKRAKATGIETIDVKLELISAKFKSIRRLGVKNGKLAWENIHPAVANYFARGSYAMETFDRTIDKWVPFGADAPARVIDTQSMLLARVVNTNTASCDLIEVPSEPDTPQLARLGQKRAALGPPKLTFRPVKRLAGQR
ncbi:hypothetical protein AURDEDRAFT_177167 [Auricularia subglabra TFB-10046 SS5]|uniref:Uncharacterized protein n=1 Tax=Auricularia subglabra (strain TFB-10046 / SS5) TaxID=717982 RepID=J0CTU4_AURST|nr:hypothetical protein AURDEDRAFT_177167 [Auricularia subglabra TFB-10046 SS5]